MFRKKHSQINIQLQNTNYSPFRKNNNCSPFTRTPERTNLSPMKAQQKNKGYSAKSPRKQFTNEQYSASKLPSTREANFQTQLEFLGNTILSEYQQFPRQHPSKLASRAPTGFQSSAFSNISNYQTSDRHMKESKKIFSNVLSKMNSDKKKAEATPSQCSLFQQSKQYQVEANAAAQGQGEGIPIASFKALKQIKMIQSIQPPLPPPPQLQKSTSKKSNHNENTFKNAQRQSHKKNQDQSQFIELVNEFKTQNKRDKIVELINQSFSINTPPPLQRIFDQINLQNDQLILGKQTKILESMDVDESFDFKQLNNLLSKLEDKTTDQNNTGPAQLQSVKVSMESAKLSLTMDPFI